ncbi:aldehyde ferredoxin oxidoreductase, partial [Candidatus Bipolaricaulota bacterium]|nr:aldehyde ferredoxin oxidoreductase [Candidatus Bipolaricaulota bacterium]
MQIVRVNVRTGKITETPVSGEQAYYGGRRLIAKVLTQEVSPICDPLGRYNKLIFAPGWLGGTAVTTSGRLSIGAKSPLTGGVKESNVGGDAGQKLARLGIRALILEDVPEEVGLRIVHVDRGGIRFAKGTHLSGHTVSETFAILREQYGNSVGLLVIGPAGEMRMTAAGVATTDREGI